MHLDVRENQSTGSLTRQHGGALVKALFLAPVALVVFIALVFAFYEGRKAYWDYQVRKMCDQDGGVSVYERTPIPKEYVDEDGMIRLPAKPADPGRPLGFEAKSTDRFYYEWIKEPIKSGELSVSRHTFNVVRSRDKRIIGSMIVYSRSGGDFPTFAHPSSTSCPKPATRPDPLDLIFSR